MIRSAAVEQAMLENRCNAKTLDSMFRRAIEHGANCSPFVSGAILNVVKNVFPVSEDDEDSNLQIGRVRLLVVAAEELPGKKLEDCLKVAVNLTLDAGPDDLEVRQRQGVPGLRRARLLRMAVEAREQGGLLTYEDLAFRLLGCGTRTIVRDVDNLQKEGVTVPTRGQQQDIGPGVTHRVQAVRLFLQGCQAREIARRLYHSLRSIENYVDTFTRVAILSERGHPEDEIGFIVQRSTGLVAAYRRLFDEHRDQPAVRHRMSELLERAASEEVPETSQKTGSNADVTNTPNDKKGVTA